MARNSAKLGMVGVRTVCEWFRVERGPKRKQSISMADPIPLSQTRLAPFLCLVFHQQNSWHGSRRPTGNKLTSWERSNRYTTIHILAVWSRTLSWHTVHAPLVKLHTMDWQEIGMNHQPQANIPFSAHTYINTPSLRFFKEQELWINEPCCSYKMHFQKFFWVVEKDCLWQMCSPVSLSQLTLIPRVFK